MSYRRTFNYRFAGRAFRLTVDTDGAFMCGDDDYVTVDCRDIAGRMESQAIIPAEDARDPMRVPIVHDAIRSAYLNATGEMMPRDAIPHASRYKYEGRNGYKAIDELRPTDGTGTYGNSGSLVFDRMNMRDVNLIVSELNSAFRRGRMYEASLRGIEISP